VEVKGLIILPPRTKMGHLVRKNLKDIPGETLPMWFKEMLKGLIEVIL
jgi:hypothetical protein